MTTTFLVPSFNKSEKGKVNDCIDVLSPHVVKKNCVGRYAVPAISSDGFAFDRDGTYVFATYIEKIAGYAAFTIGVTSTKTVDSSSTFAVPGVGALNGIALFFGSGELVGGTGEYSKRWSKEYLASAITKTAKEVVTVFTISNNGTTRSIQYIVDSTEGPCFLLDQSVFENQNGRETFAVVVTLQYENQKLKLIPFNQVISRSPKIDELMREFLSSEEHNNSNEQEPAKKAPIKKTEKKAGVSKTKKTAIIKTETEKKAPAKKKAAKKVTKKAGKK